LTIVGVIPAAGYATRLQPLSCSKEVMAIGGQPVMDYLLERMKRGGASEIRVVTRPDKEDVIENARRHSATVIEGCPPSPAASLVAGIEGLADDDVVLFGFPDSIWQPVDGFRRTIELLDEERQVALGLFRTDKVERPDVTTLAGNGVTVTGIEVGSRRPPPHLIWGCGAARASALSALRHHDDPGEYLRSLCATGAVAGVLLSGSYLDTGTRHGLGLAHSSSVAR
jgi:glucose-1-phosphate thymidylyltransferase